MIIERKEHSTVIYPFEDNHDYHITVYHHHPACSPAVKVMLPVMTLDVVELCEGRKKKMGG